MKPVYQVMKVRTQHKLSKQPINPVGNRAAARKAMHDAKRAGIPIPPKPRKPK